MINEGEPGAAAPQADAGMCNSLFLERMAQYPLVNSLTEVYSRTKAMVPLVSRAEDALKATVPFQDQLDKFACASLDRLETATAKPIAASQNIVRNLVQQTVVLRSVQARAVTAATGAARDTILRAEASVSALTGRVVSVADACVDMLLPGEEEQQQPPVSAIEPAATETAPILGDEARKVVGRVCTLSTKAKERVMQRAARRLQQVQASSQGLVDSVKPYTFDLIAYARDTLLSTQKATTTTTTTTTTKACGAVAPAARAAPLAAISARTAELKALLADRIMQLRDAAQGNVQFLLCTAITVETAIIDKATVTVHQFPHLEAALEALLSLPGARTAWIMALNFVPERALIKQQQQQQQHEDEEQQQQQQQPAAAIVADDDEPAFMTKLRRRQQPVVVDGKPADPTPADNDDNKEN